MQIMRKSFAGTGLLKSLANMDKVLTALMSFYFTLALPLEAIARRGGSVGKGSGGGFVPGLFVGIAVTIGFLYWFSKKK